MNEDISLDDYKYLWDGSEPGWILCNLAKEGEEPRYFIENIITSVGLIIELEEEEKLVIDIMLKNNVKIVNSSS